MAGNEGTSFPSSFFNNTNFFFAFIIKPTHTRLNHTLDGVYLFRFRYRQIITIRGKVGNRYTAYTQQI